MKQRRSKETTMKLSDAILLGDSLKHSTSSAFLYSMEGKVYGCAIGGAILADGGTVAQWMGDRQINGIVTSSMKSITSRWPWLKQEYIDRISRFYDDVVNGVMTLEALADWVRSIEPKEEAQKEEVQNEGIQYQEVLADSLH